MTIRAGGRRSFSLALCVSFGSFNNLSPCSGKWGLGFTMIKMLLLCMSSIVSALVGIGMGRMAIANVATSFVLSAVDNGTKSNINMPRYDYYYWLLAAMVIWFISWCLVGFVCRQTDGKKSVGGKGMDEE